MAKAWGPYAAVIASIHDGDTVEVDIVLVKAGKLRKDRDLGFNVHREPGGVLLRGQSVRVFGMNAPELATPEGKAAVAYLRTVLATGDAVTLLSHGWDKYGGRIDGEITLRDGTNLADVMIAAGHARPWDGRGPKPV